jgi:hypothetical protein
MQGLPSFPHCVWLFPAWHAPVPSQHPWQFPALQSAVFWHPPLMQVSADGQALHDPPFVPHALVVLPGWQFPLPSQQPVQLDGLHEGLSQTPPEQVSPFAQTVHVPPPKPQSAVDAPGWQLPSPSQQPPQFWGPHAGGFWHSPPLHDSVDGQLVHAPPPKPQFCDVWPPWQLPFPSQHPPQFWGPHDCPWQKPPKQAAPGGQKLHVLPPVPQLLVLSPGWQLPFWSQHP